MSNDKNCQKINCDLKNIIFDSELVLGDTKVIYSDETLKTLNLIKLRIGNSV